MITGPLKGLISPEPTTRSQYLSSSFAFIEVWLIVALIRLTSILVTHIFFSKPKIKEIDELHQSDPAELVKFPFYWTMVIRAPDP